MDGFEVFRDGAKLLDYACCLLMERNPELWRRFEDARLVEGLTRLEALFHAVGDPKDYEEYVYSQLKTGKAHSLDDHIETRIEKWLQSQKWKRERVQLGINDDLLTLKCEECGSTTALEKPTETVVIYWTRNGKIKPLRAFRKGESDNIEWTLCKRCLGDISPQKRR